MMRNWNQLCKAERVKEMSKNCVHYWILNSQNFGVCKLCGSERQFPTVEEVFRQMQKKAESEGKGAPAGASTEGGVKQ